MNLSSPYLAVLPETTGQVLSSLAATDRPLSGREVARLSGGAHSTVARVLQRLAEHGLIQAQEVGSGAALLYTLNREHLAAEPVLALVSLRRRFIERLKNELGSWTTPALHASLFGSAARADGDTSSDVDLFIVRPKTIPEDDRQWRTQLDRLPELILSWTGNHAGIAEVAAQELSYLRQERPPVTKELEKDAVTLVGPHVRELIGQES